jgi:hypothetical protein
LEVAVARQLEEANIQFRYEAFTLNYIQPEVQRRCTPDFVLANGIIVESKGRFLTEDRKKMRLIKEQHPDLDIRFVFSNPNTRISKTSKTTYGKWAADHGFPYAAKKIPDAWLHEPRNEKSMAAIKALNVKRKARKR